MRKKSKLKRLSETSQWASFACFAFAVKHTKLAHFPHVLFWFRMVLRGSWKRNCHILTLFRLVLPAYSFVSRLFRLVSLCKFASFCFTKFKSTNRKGDGVSFPQQEVDGQGFKKVVLLIGIDALVLANKGVLGESESKNWKLANKLKLL
jgi:hypothetical protein